MSRRDKLLSGPSAPSWIPPSINPFKPAPVGPAAVADPAPATPVSAATIMVKMEEPKQEPVEMQGRTGRWKVNNRKSMSEAPRDGTEILVYGCGAARQAKWIKDGEGGYWSDVWLTAGSPTPRRLMFEPSAWTEEG